MDVQIRALTEIDLQDFKALRLAALKEAPDAFSASYEENLTRPDGYFLQLLGQAPNRTFGAFEGTALIGKAGFVVEQGAKARHKGFLWGVYVAPALRGRGIGERLVTAVIDHARGQVESLRSAVVATNKNAAQLYQRLGFVTYGVEPRALKVGEAYLDEELIVLRF